MNWLIVHKDTDIVMAATLTRREIYDILRTVKKLHPDERFVVQHA
jgi:hypothetical protein